MRRRSLLAASAAVLLLPSKRSPAAPKAELWPRWQAHDPASDRSVDHQAWAAFLARYRQRGPEDIALVNYVAVTPADRLNLRAYLDFLQKVEVSTLARAEQLGFWMNLYNALTVDIVLQHYPVHSIRDIDISPGLFANGPWGARLAQVEGEALSLDDIEHRIVRPIWRDPRIHYGFNCASLGCPDLHKRPFVGSDVDEQLHAAAAAFVSHPRGVRIRNGRIVASRIYDWYRSDFGGSDWEIIRHLMTYASPKLAMKLQHFDEIDEFTYDWRLNEAGASSTR